MTRPDLRKALFSLCRRVPLRRTQDPISLPWLHSWLPSAQPPSKPSFSPAPVSAQALPSCLESGYSNVVARGQSPLLSSKPPSSPAIIQGFPSGSERAQAYSTAVEIDFTDHGEGDLGHVRWVFLGAPGVGKGTYAGRLGKLLGVPHISMGDLVREELPKGTPLAGQMQELTSKGHLLPDDIVLSLLRRRLLKGAAAGESGFILDGFPRTTSQAASLDDVTPIDVAVNLSLREDILLRKLLGRRICVECGGNFNVADIQIPAANSRPGIFMPPLPPPGACESKMTVRADDTEEVVRSRLEVYYRESKPVEDFYRARGQLLEFEIQGGIPETWPRLLHALGVSEEGELLAA